jgi:hypothetical protein
MEKKGREWEKKKKETEKIKAGIRKGIKRARGKYNKHSGRKRELTEEDKVQWRKKKGSRKGKRGNKMKGERRKGSEKRKRK